MSPESARRAASVAAGDQGHVAGGQCFGYDNVPIAGPDGRRSHVERRINATAAAVVRRIFELCAAGYGYRKIAITLNDERAVSPRAQRGRSQSWAPSSVNEALHRPLYRGEIVWNATRKRDTWGRHAQHARPEAEWMRREAPDLRIVSEALWRAAYARLDAARATYLAGTQGNPWGRPPTGGTTKYLLSGLSRCAVCSNGKRPARVAWCSRCSMIGSFSGRRWWGKVPDTSWRRISRSVAFS
jgi:site-specific DNA recombinase